MAKAKSKGSPSALTDDKSTIGYSSSTIGAPEIKSEDLDEPDPMTIDSPSQYDATPTAEIKLEMKTESRTVSPAPLETSISQQKYGFDGALLLEDPDFDEDFTPAEGEELDMTSLAIAAPAPPPGEADVVPFNKRALDDTEDGFDDGQLQKRRRLDEMEEAIPISASFSSPGPNSGTTSVDRLNPNLWIEIFAYVGLPGIGRLRSVCKRFSELLEKEYIWRRCRKIHCPDMPKPAFSMKEWEMWSLARGKGCYKCDKYKNEARNEANLKVYWQFRVRCCVSCLRENLIKEADLISREDDRMPVEVMKQLISALPYGLVDSSYNWVPTTTANPSDAERVYWAGDISKIKERYEEAQQMDAAEEWLKGLEGEGHGHKADADRMEKWEVRVMNGNSYNPSTNSTRKGNAGDKTSGKEAALPSKSSSGIPVLVSNDNAPFQPQSIPSFYQRGRQFGDRSQEVEDMKARRKADIETRCSKLVPPISPEILSHCPAFQASLKIPQALNEQSWNALLPKLLEQRVSAEELERQRQIQKKEFEQQLEDRKMLETQERDQWVKKERQWEEAQNPVREMISKIADEEIKGWDGKVKFETAPAFAASILTVVRARYYERGGVRETSSVSDNMASSSSNNPAKTQADRLKTRQLVLENMKYVFDNKIKPVTDPFRRELFFCKACKNIAANPAPGVPVPHTKLYGFEGVIQHFAAKHTAKLSLGTVVVHWRSAWPEDAPFVVDPNEIKRLMTKPTAHLVNTPGPLLIRTSGPPVPVSVQGPYQYPPQPGHHHPQPHPHPHPHPHQHSQHLHHGPSPQPLMHAPGAFGRGPQRQPYPVENTHQPGYHQPQSAPHLPNHAHTHAHSHATQVPQHPYSHPGHQPYSVQGPGPAPPGPAYQPQTPVGYPAQPVYNQNHHQPPPQQATPHRQHFPGYQPQFSPAAPQHQAHYNSGYRSMTTPTATQGPGNMFGPPQTAQPMIPQPDPYEEAAKKEAEAAAAAAAAEKDHKDKIRFIANHAEQAWKNLVNLKNLEYSIRALLMIHETYAAYSEKFKTELSVHLFHEAIRTEIEGPLKFLKQGNCTFECRSCLRSHRAFTLPLLFQHFESIHVSRPNLGPSAKEQGVKQKRFNWLIDMIRLPPEGEVQKLMMRPGFDRKKMAPVEQAYPGVFEKKPIQPAPAKIPVKDIAIDTSVAAPKHASKDSMSAAEDFLNNLLPSATVESQGAKSNEIPTGSVESATMSPEPEDRGRPRRPGRVVPSHPISRSRSHSLDGGRARSPRRKGSFEDDGYRRPLARDPAYPVEPSRRYPADDPAGYYRRPMRARSPGPYDRYPPPVEYRVYHPYDDYDMVPRERYPHPHPPQSPPHRQAESQAATAPPPAGGLDYDEIPAAPIPVSGHVRDASRDTRYPEEFEYRRGYPPPPAGYYERVVDRDMRYPPPPPPPRDYYERVPPRYYDERVVHHPIYYDEVYEYDRARPPAPPVRVYREEYDRYYDRVEGYRRPPPPPPAAGAPRDRELDDAFDRATGRDVRRGRSRSPEMDDRDWPVRERRGYGGGGGAASPRGWRDEAVRGGRGGGFRGRGGRGG